MDQVVLKSGDRISGKLLRDEPEEISIETDFAGIITVRKSFIDKVLNEKERASPITGTSLPGRLARRGPPSNMTSFRNSTCEASSRYP